MATTPMSLQQFGQTVKAKHPEYADMADEDLAQRVLSKYPQYQDMVAPGVPKAPIPAGLQGPPTPTSPPSMMQGAGSAVGDFVQGVGKGAMNTLSPVLGGLSYGVQKASQALGIPANLLGTVPQSMRSSIYDVRQESQPANTAQAIGRGVEQAGEFLIPGGAEEAAAGRLATMAPRLGKYALPAAHVATGALSAGLVNKAQGGDFGPGAALGGSGEIIGQTLKAAAPMMAETALGVRATDRAARRTPGQMIINETKGINPGTIAEQAKAKVTDWTNALESGVNQSPIPVDLTPARMISSNAETAAALRNNPDTIRRTGQLSSLLNKEFGTNAAIPPQVSASRALDLKRGTGELKGSWNPATPNDFADSAVGKVYGSLNEGINQAFPGAEQLNQNISSMMPVSARAGAKDLNASTLQRVMGRFGRPTGALAGSLFGAGAGYHEGGVPGMLMGGAAGIVAPEVLASPTTQMLFARGLNRGATPIVRTLLGGSLQANRPASLYDLK